MIVSHTTCLTTLWRYLKLPSFLGSTLIFMLKTKLKNEHPSLLKVKKALGVFLKNKKPLLLKILTLMM